MTAQHYTYQQYKTTAYTGGDVTVVNDRIYDVAGRNPYETKTVFAVAPMKSYLEGNTFSFMLQSNMLYTNSNLTLNKIEIDFGNGQGYQIISLNTAKNISYTTSGEKELKIKFTYTSGTILHSHAKLYVDYIPAQAQARFSGSPWTEEIPGANYLGASAIGDVTIETAGSDGVLDKPLIVVEGFDPQGRFNYDDLIDYDRPGGIDVIISEPGQPLKTLNQAIENEGYDLVFINYRNGTDYILRNAYMVEAVIEWVNDNKVGDGKNVVLGMSMGGLVARYALSHMESMGKIHETKLYISHDAPHQGANVPLAYQAFVRHLAGESIGWPVFLGFFTIDIVDLPDLVPALSDGLNLLSSPAAQEMLIYQLSGTGGSTAVASANSLQTTFLNEFRSLGYPQQGGIRNIAISNGSECGTPLNFAPYATLANLDKTVDLPWFTTNIIFTVANAWSVNPIRALTSLLSTDTDIKAMFDLKALPNQQAQQIYSGRIYIKKEVLWLINVEEPLIGGKSISSTSSMLPIDNSGGGVYDISQFLGQLPSSVKQFIFEERFNFIPTYSSLDIGSGTQPIVPNDLARVYSPVGPPLAPKNTPFHNFYTNPTTSENHVQFTLKNGNWLMEELDEDEIFGFYSCASSCASLPELPITGTSTICTGGNTITLTNVSPSAGVSWQVTPANLFAISNGSGSNALLTPLSSSSSSPASLTYTIAGSCGVPIQVQKSLWVGKPRIERTQLTNGNLISYSSSVTNKVCNLLEYTTDVAGGGNTSTNWSRIAANPTNASWSLAANGNIRFYFYQVGQTATFRINYGNICGSRFYDFKFQSINCSSDPCSQYLVSPNPASSSVNIIVPNIPAPCGTTALDASIEVQSELSIGSVTLIDLKGQVQYSQQFSDKSKKIDIDVSQLNKGVYILKIYSGSSISEDHRIIIE